MKDEVTAKRVAIVGGGLAGSLNAVYLGTRGYKVDVYESKADIRVTDKYKGRSINLALSARGIAALEKVGLDEMVKDTGIPMPGRIIHNLDGKTSFIPYGKKGQHIFSISRGKLNVDLLTAADELPNVDIHCEHKLIDMDIKNGRLSFKVPGDVEKTVEADVIFGNDGANSIVRKEIMKRTRLNYSQQYIEHGYKEIAMLPKNGEYAMDPNGLHIWPRQTFMMIALPNQDDVVSFFEKEFPDSIPLYGKENLINEYMTNVVGSMISIKCDPYHFQDNVIFFGDAAHAMVPFYGQGMNCALEDVRVFNGFLDEFNDNMGLAMQAFSRSRNADAKTICDLSMQNYIEVPLSRSGTAVHKSVKEKLQYLLLCKDRYDFKVPRSRLFCLGMQPSKLPSSIMRSSVTSRSFLLKKYVDNFLHWLMPNTFIPKYTMVAFTIIPYHEVVERTRWQDKIIDRGIRMIGFSSIAGITVIMMHKLYLHLR